MEMSATASVMSQVLPSHVTSSRTNLRRDDDTRGGDHDPPLITISGKDCDRDGTSKRAADLSETVEIRV
jgi:hypothetical protein